MRNYLENDGRFYHISPAKNKGNIEQLGLERSNKGICVLRTNNDGIVNAVINSQLSMEIKNGAEFILVEFRIAPAQFPIYVFEPDILTSNDWTWPLHNNIIVDRILPNCFVGITQHTYNQSDGDYFISNKHLFETQEWFQSSYRLIYENHYRMNADSSINNIEERKLVKSVEAHIIDSLNNFF